VKYGVLKYRKISLQRQSTAGLPDDLFSNQKSQFGKNSRASDGKNI
jgi:hypothetical protein